MSEAAEKFKKYLKEINYYSRAVILFDWDMYTATPRRGYGDMADAEAYFGTRQFELSTSDEFLELLERMNEPEEYEKLDEGYQYTARILLRDLKKNRNIPKDFYSEFLMERGLSQKAWEDAKNADDFSLFAPHLEKMISMIREKASYTDPGKDVYDVLLDQFEEGMHAQDIDRAFEELKAGLLPLLDRILAAPQPEDLIRKGTYDINQQKQVQKLLLTYIGFDFEAGTVSESMHPFTTGFSRRDVRITNHYYLHDPASAMFSAIHEGGHGIFEQNVAPELSGTAADDCRYMGVHESQSRFFENILGRRKSFWIPVWSRVQSLLPDLQSVSLDEWTREINHVQCTPIRTEADEVTYCLHIILRYEMEQEIFRGGASVSDLPAMWNEKTEKYLHLTPKNDAEGILQDMHWSDGSFGYFPSYLLGSIYDGMFLEAMEKDLGDIDALLADGKIGIIRQWLNEKIHRYGSLRLPKEVLRQVCGKELTAKPLLTYFEDKYTNIYPLS